MVLMKRGKELKKVLLIIFCFLISISITACSNNSNSKVQNTVNERTSVQEDTSVDDTNKAKNNNIHNEKSISRLYISYSGINMDITSDESKISELLELEKMLKFRKQS